MEEVHVFVKHVRRRNKMKKIALTGNIGCGKSYVSRHLAKQGVFVFDCDKIAFEVRNAHIDSISKMFEIDATDTKQLASVIFSEDAKRIKLENYLYPFILEKMNALFQEYKDEKIIVIEVPLLYEKNWDIYFDEVWVVSVKEETAIKRLINDRNMKEEDVRARLKKQMPLQKKEEKADFIIYNNEEDDIETQIQYLLKKEGVLC